jgi:hypothetical protein
MSAALVAAWVVSFVAPVVLELLKSYAERNNILGFGLRNSQPDPGTGIAEKQLAALVEIRDVLREINVKLDREGHSNVAERHEDT